MEKFKKFLEKVKAVWDKVVAFKGTKYIVVLGLAAIVFIVVIAKSNSVFVLEGTSKLDEKVVFISIESTGNCYNGSEKEKNPDGSDKGEDYNELWLVVEGFTSKQSYENGEQAVYNSDTTKETFYNGTSKVVPYHFSNENITSTRAMGVQHRITSVVRKVQEEMTRDDGSKYTKTVSYRPTVWYQIDKSNISKLESYTYSTFIELSKYEADYNAKYFRVTFKLNDTETKFFRDFEL